MKNYTPVQNIAGAGVVYISTRLCFKVYYEPFIANLFSMFNIMISPCRRFIGTVFSAKSVKNFPCGYFFSGQRAVQNLSRTGKRKTLGGGSSL